MRSDNRESAERAERMVAAAERLGKAVNRLRFSAPVDRIYNPLDYAWEPHADYIRRFAGTPKRVLLMGMNPGPFGMAQTGVPFGEIASVREWMGISGAVGRPENEHPKRPIEGFACARSEVSGRRLWGLFAERFPSAEAFFADHFAVNYCPLVFMGETARNITPDKLPAKETGALYAACNAHLVEVVEILQPEFFVGVGAFAEGRAREALGDWPGKFGRILHPSPASPAANRGWAEQATRQLEALGVW